MYHMTKKNIDQHFDVLDLDFIVDVHHVFFFMKDAHSIGF